jgi:HSP20 family protein
MPTLRWHPMGMGQMGMGQIWNEFARAENGMNRSLRYFDTGDPADRSGVPAEYPQVNLWDDDECMYFEAELPGVTLEDLEITIADGNRLTLKGQRKPPEAGETTWHRRERSFGSFSRTLALPVLVDPDRIEAHFESGDLRVKLPKSPKAKPRRIEVKQS